MFYILAILNILFRINSMVLIFWDDEHADIFFRTIPALIKLNIGVLTIWIMLELSMRVDQSINFFNIIFNK